MPSTACSCPQRVALGQGLQQLRRISIQQPQAAFLRPPYTPSAGQLFNMSGSSPRSNLQRVSMLTATSFGAPTEHMAVHQQLLKVSARAGLPLGLSHMCGRKRRPNLGSAPLVLLIAGGRRPAAQRLPPDFQVHRTGSAAARAHWGTAPAPPAPPASSPAGAPPPDPALLSPAPPCRHHHPELASKVDVIFALAQSWSMTESDSDFEMLEARLSQLTPDERILVSRAGGGAVAGMGDRWVGCVWGQSSS